MKGVACVTAAACIAAAAASAQSTRLADELLAITGPHRDSALLDVARSRPDDLREALRRALIKASTAHSDSLVDNALDTAAEFARAYATAWQDSFFVRQVARFRSLSASGRRAKVAADNARRAGNAALARSGPAAAMRSWRESLRRFEQLHDSVGVAAAEGNLGAGFYELQMLDSAEWHLARSRALANAVGDRRTEGNAIGLLANVSKDRGNRRDATELYLQASTVRERSGDVRGLAADRNNLGLIAQDRGDWAAARVAFESALAANRAADRRDAAATDLVNLGNLAGLQGEYASARARYDEARTIYHESGSRVDEAFALHNLGTLALRRGDYRASLRVLTSALTIYRETGPAVEEIAVERDLVSARAAIGDLQGARIALERAERLTQRPNVEGAAELRAQLALARGDLALQFNDLLNAERSYATAEALARRLPPRSHLLTEAWAARATVPLIRGDFASARLLLQQAMATRSLAADSRQRAMIQFTMGETELRAGNATAARRLLDDAMSSFNRLDDAVSEATVLGALGELALREVKPVQADSLYRRALLRLTSRTATDLTWQVHAGLARGFAMRGQTDRAAQEYDLAISEVEKTTSALPGDQRRSAYRADKWNPYTELALLEQSRGRSHAAFAVSERLRARQMLDILARGRIDVAGLADTALVTREQDLRRHIAYLQHELETSSDSNASLRASEPSSSGSRPTLLQDRLASAEQEYSELRERLQEADTSYARLMQGATSSPDDIERALGPEDALLEYLVGDTTTIAFVVTADSVASVDLGIARGALANLVDFARGTLTSKRVVDAPDAWRPPFQRLYQRLLAPIEQRGLLTGRRRLLIVPHGELHYVPFAALVGPAGDPLVFRYSIEYAPSASVWLRLRGRTGRRSNGDVLAMAPRVAGLPATRDEVNGVARVLSRRGEAGEARVLVGTEASERAFRALAPRAEFVHLATDGVLNKENPLFSYVQLAPGGGEDGRLEVHEIFGIPLRARLVVLSACQTGLGSGTLSDVPPGDDWIGLVRTLLFAGTSNVVATLWPVEDRSTAQLVKHFYVGLAQSRSIGDALAESQRTMAREARTAHPFYWAGLALFSGE